MKSCKLVEVGKGRAFWDGSCEICGVGPCKNLERPTPLSGGTGVQRAPLSRKELADVRATAMALAIQLLGPMTSHEQANEAAFELLDKIAERMLNYVTDESGRSP